MVLLSQRLALRSTDDDRDNDRSDLTLLRSSTSSAVSVVTPMAVVGRLIMAAAGRELGIGVSERCDCSDDELAFRLNSLRGSERHEEPELEPAGETERAVGRCLCST